MPLKPGKTCFDSTTRRILSLFTVLLVLPFGVQAEFPYYGKLIQNGFGSNPSHGLAGSIYAVNENSFQVTGFTFDAIGGDSAFLLGVDKDYATASGSGADSTAVAISNPLGQSAPLRAYNGETVMLELPTGMTLSDYKYIAVGNKTTKELYGGADIPNGFSAPAPQNVGTFSSLAHGVASGDVTVLNDRMISIKAFRYDGQGPDAFFYVGTTNNVAGGQRSPYGKIPDENGNSQTKAKAYSDRDIVLTLPDTMSVTDLKWLSMFCISYAHDFGNVKFPANLNVPPYSEIDIDRNGMNCEKLDDDLQVSWLIEGDVITIELAGNIDRNKDYMAFGLSGSETATAMINADVVVADFRDNDMPRAIDYHLTSYAQCAGNGGACPDTSSSNSAADDVMTVTGQVTNGITRVKYQRALTTGDVGTNKDKVFKVDGSQQTIVWAIGPLNTKMEAAKHYNGKRQSTTTLTKINFNRTVADNCPSFVVLDDVELPDFQPHHLYGEEGTVFTVEIGQAGSEQGYKALTGLPSWGIAWYVNGILIPELHLKRGVSYTFRVGGGTDPKEGSKYHPLYFTNDVEGGFNQTGNGTIYPGKVDGNAMQYAVGGYCEWKLRSSAVARLDSGFIYPCFETFQKDLYLDCDSTGEYTDFVFTPDSSTPDLLYYQCYTHKSLGWKVHVYDELPTNRIADIPCLAESFATCSSVSISLLMLLALLNLLFA